MERDRRHSAGDWDLVSKACRILSSSSSIKCSVYLIQLLIGNCSPEHRFFYLYVNAPLCSVLGHILHLLCLSLERGLNNSLIFWNRYVVFCRSHCLRSNEFPRVSFLQPLSDGETAQEGDMETL